MLRVVKLNVNYKPLMLSGIMLSVVMLNFTNKPFMFGVVMLNVIMLSVVAPLQQTVVFASGFTNH